MCYSISCILSYWAYKGFEGSSDTVPYIAFFLWTKVVSHFAQICYPSGLSCWDSWYGDMIDDMWVNLYGKT